MTSPRIERDPLGEKAVPEDALYGIQTLRAAENFPISGLRPLPAFVDAVVWIKRSAALTHKETGRLEGPLADAIVKAADEVLGGRHRDQFIVDVYQAGAGTSHNMNVNEVLANRANEILGKPRGVYAPVHPNDHVNMAQSTNDVIPTAMRLAVLATLPSAARRARCSRQPRCCQGHGVRRHREVGPHPPAGCDAHPTGPGVHRLRAHGARHREKLAQAADWLREMNIGGTAVGTGHQRRAQVPGADGEVSAPGERARRPRRRTTGSSSCSRMGDIATLSGAFRAYVLDLNKIANDIRLLASGPRTGLAEIVLPPCSRDPASCRAR